MALESVSLRSDGEVPSADELNELLIALRAIFNAGGIPLSAFPWPLTADGNLDMNGYDILNVTSVNGVINVNVANPLSAAISAANAVGNTLIVIDPGYKATTGSAGLTISGDGITIIGRGGAQIDGSDLLSTGACLTITGDNCTISDVEFITTGIGTNIDYIIKCAGAANTAIRDNVFTDCHGGVLLTDFGGARSSLTQIVNNRFDGVGGTSVKLTCIEGDNCEDVNISQNTIVNLPTLTRAISMNGGIAVTMPNISITNNSVRGTTVSCEGIYAFGGTAVLVRMLITGNSVNTTATPVFIQSADEACVTGNHLTGPAPDIRIDDGVVSGNQFETGVGGGNGCILGGFGTQWSSNRFGGDASLATCNIINFSNNFVLGGLISLDVWTDVRIDGNLFVSNMSIPTTVGYVASFRNNTGQGTMGNILDYAEVYANNHSLVANGVS
jgi:hypothetical protein